MAKTTKKPTTSKKSTQRKGVTAKESPKNSKKPTVRSSNKTARVADEGRTRKAVATKKTVGETEVTVDRRRSDRRTSTEPALTERRKLERREKVTRRRQIDPTTCERDYSDDEVEFMNALDNYKRASGRMFPTCSEILEVIRELGYAKKAPVQGDSATAQTDGNERTNGSDSPESEPGMVVAADCEGSIDEEVLV
ncbi:MAG: hypothetical protein GXX96_23885 [Planctomycetaceae bacterium]|nr:hypothetical protein [Planctomycetaceae bacterium]